MAGQLSFADFVESSRVAGPPPAQLSPALKALWCDHQGRWDEAHRWVQESSAEADAWVHAYLHRKEGDLPNASYWYRMAGRTTPSAKLDEEWEQLARTLLKAPV